MTPEEFDLYIQDDNDLLNKLESYAYDEIVKHQRIVERSKSFEINSISYTVYNFEELDDCYILMLSFYAECFENIRGFNENFDVDGNFDFSLDKTNAIFNKIRRNDKIEDLLN